MTERDLPSKLWLFSKSIADKVKEYKNNRKIVKVSRLYVKPKVEKFEYKKGSTSYTKSFKYIKREEWHWKDQFDFIERTIKQLPGYIALTSEISKKYKVKRAQSDFWLSRFVQNLVQKMLTDGNDEVLIDAITTFIADLEKSPIDWKLKIWIEGLWLDEEEYEIHDDLKIRRPKPSDLEIERPFDLLPFSITESGFKEISPAIMELAYRARTPSEIQSELERILSCLRLFRVGSVFSLKYKMYPKSFLAFGGIHTSGQKFAPIYKYRISKQDLPELRSFLEKIKDLLPSTQDSGKTDPVVIALERYNDALLKSASVESRITSAITCFEALYLKAKERTELSHRLSQRASAILRVFSFNPLEVYNTLSHAYEVRSIFIHGSQTPPEWQKSISRTAEKILEYARVSLLVFLQLKEVIDKEKLIGRIDNSLLEGQVYQKLENFLKENCTIC